LSHELALQQFQLSSTTNNYFDYVWRLAMSGSAPSNYQQFDEYFDGWRTTSRRKGPATSNYQQLLMNISTPDSEGIMSLPILPIIRNLMNISTLTTLLSSALH
jgi:hypothetical protein